MNYECRFILSSHFTLHTIARLTQRNDGIVHDSVMSMEADCYSSILLPIRNEPELMIND